MAVSRTFFQELVFIQEASAVLPNVTGQAPYILCNEAQQPETLVKLKEMAELSSSSSSSEPAKLHLGFSVWFNLDLLAATPADYAIILDIDPKANIIYQHIQAALIATDTRTAFIQVFLTKLEKSDLLS